MSIEGLPGSNQTAHWLCHGCYTRYQRCYARCHHCITYYTLAETKVLPLDGAVCNREECGKDLGDWQGDLSTSPPPPSPPYGLSTCVARLCSLIGTRPSPPPPPPPPSLLHQGRRSALLGRTFSKPYTGFPAPSAAIIAATVHPNRKPPRARSECSHHNSPQHPTGGQKKVGRPIGGAGVGARCAFSDRILHSRMPLSPTHVRVKRAGV
jgi:hypothetical protein